MISTNKPAFRCSDETFNEIWRVCERSVWQHPGQDPVTAHADSMADHTFYWFLSIYEHYLYTGNERCVRQTYPRMRKFINYCLSHTDSNGMIQIKSDDQVFVDWLPENRDRKGLRSFEQILYCKSLEDMAQCAHLLGRKADEERYFAHFTRLRKQILPSFWNEKRQALVHRVVDGRRSRLITRHSNVFAIFFDYFTEAQKQEVASTVINNPSVKPFTSPFMQFYELAALCSLGNLSQVLERIRKQWNSSLLKAQLSSPEAEVDEKLCYAWGICFLYLFGRYFLGVKPVKPGYEEFEIRPELGGLEFIEGKVPLPKGEISVYRNADLIRIQASSGSGYLYFSSSLPPKASRGEIEKFIGKNQYRLWIDAGDEVGVTFTQSPSSKTT